MLFRSASDLQARLPAGLTVDRFEGRAHLGVVGFRMNAVRPAGLPALPWLSYFRELNVRTYVRDADGEPGVWFFSLDCDRAPAVALARAWFGLPYEHATMGFGPGLAEFVVAGGEAFGEVVGFGPGLSEVVNVGGKLGAESRDFLPAAV